MPPHPLTNLKYKSIVKSNQNLTVFSRNYLPKIKDGTYVISLDECKSIGTHWIVL